MIPGNGAGDFGRLLKHWRSVRRESQLGLSCAAGVSARHVAFIETGRARPSRGMVLTLAQVLDVPLREQNVLLRAAGFADHYAESALDAPAIAPTRRSLEVLLARHEPYPAMVVDTAWNLLLANRAARRLFVIFSIGAAPPRARNVLRILFEPRGMRAFVRNWPEIGASLLRRLQRDAVGSRDDAPVRRLLAELLALPGVGDLLAGPRVDPALPVIPLVLERGRRRLCLCSLVSSFPSAVDVTLEALRIETLLPVDDASERALRSMARRRRSPG